MGMRQLYQWRTMLYYQIMKHSDSEGQLRNKRLAYNLNQGL